MACLLLLAGALFTPRLPRRFRDRRGGGGAQE
jgi:hypothetical protein